MKYIISFLSVFAQLLIAQQFEVTGIVQDQESNEPLIYASVQIEGTTRGTVTNKDGAFSIKITDRGARLLVRFIGYKPDTISVSAKTAGPLLIKMIKQPIMLEELVVTDENPAYRIIREAIKRKHKNKEGLNNFEYSMYSKMIMESDGEIAMIEEAFVKGYNKYPEWEKEFILKTHKTENRKKEIRTNSVDFSDKYFLDFSTDTLNLLMNTVYLPLADNAFDHYDYKLLDRIETETAPIYKIQVIAESKIQPLLEGTIFIEGENYAIVNVDLQSSKGVRFPYIQNLKLLFKQSLGKYEGYWLPDYVEIKGSFEFNFGGLIAIEPLAFQTVNSITEYKVNKPIPDSVTSALKSKYGGFTPDTTKDKYLVPVALTDSAIAAIRPIPLSKEEKSAFESIDSSFTIDKAVKVKGALAGLIPDREENDTSGAGIFMQSLDFLGSYLYINNNRVSTISLGGRYSSDLFDSNFYTDTYAAYSFGLKKAIGSFQLGYRIDDFFLRSVEAQIYYTPKEWMTYHPYSMLHNSLSVLFGYQDQFNFILSSGFNIRTNIELSKRLNASLGFTSEKQTSLSAIRYISIFNRDRAVRTNPVITEGFDRKLNLNLKIGNSPFEFQLMPNDGAELNVELSNKFFASDFNYLRFFAAGQVRFKTFYDELFVSPYLMINAEAGLVSGGYNIQNILTPITKLGFYSPAGAFKGLNPYTFAGNKMAALHIEHNWRTVIFQALGLDFLTNYDLDIITGGAVLKIENDKKLLTNESNPKPYWETYISLSRILGIIRFDTYYNSFKDVGVTLSTAVIF